MAESRTPAKQESSDRVATERVGRRLPPAPIVSAFVSGLVIGAVLALLAAGVISGPSHTASPQPTLPVPTPIGDANLYSQVSRLVNRQLGAWAANPKVPRLIWLGLVPTPISQPQPDPGMARYRSVIVIFHLNDHPLGKAWRVRAAKADVFAVMRALYTSQLPIFNVEMRGMFPLPQHGKSKSTLAVVAFMGHTAASRVPWRTLHRVDESRLWSMLTRSYINPLFG